MKKPNAATQSGAADELDENGRPKNAEPSLHTLQIEEIAQLQRAQRDAGSDDDEPNEEDEDRPDAAAIAAAAAEAAGAVAAEEEEEEEETGEEDAAAVAAAAALAEAATAAAAGEVEYVTIKVDGIEMKVDKSKVVDAGVRSLQKESAADLRLRQANELLATVQARENEINARLAKDTDSELSLDEDELGSIGHDIAHGDDTQRTEAVKKLVKAVQGAKATKGQSLTPAEVQAVVAKELDRGKFESALELIKKPKAEGGYGELFDGGILEAAFGFEDNRLFGTEEGKNLSYLERFKQVGENVRKTFGMPTGGGGGNTPNNGSRNAQRKAGLGAAPSSASAPAGGGEQKKLESASKRHQKAIEGMQQARRPVP